MRTSAPSIAVPLRRACWISRSFICTLGARHHAERDELPALLGELDPRQRARRWPLQHRAGGRVEVARVARTDESLPSGLVVDGAREVGALLAVGHVAIGRQADEDAGAAGGGVV